MKTQITIKAKDNTFILLDFDQEDVVTRGYSFAVERNAEYDPMITMSILVNVDGKRTVVSKGHVETFSIADAQVEWIATSIGVTRPLFTRERDPTSHH